MNEADHEQDLKNYADQGMCYSPRLKARVDSTLPDLHNSLYPMKAEFIYCFIIPMFSNLNDFSMFTSHSNRFILSDVFINESTRETV